MQRAVVTLGLVAGIVITACGDEDTTGGGGGGTATGTATNTSTCPAGNMTELVGSCLQGTTCTAYVGTADDVAQASTRATTCTNAGGTWSDGECPTTDLIAHCRDDRNVLAILTSFYTGSPIPETDIVAMCTGDCLTLTQ